MKVYFNEYNLPMEDTIYLPLASGMLSAYAQKFNNIKNKYEFMPFIFKRDTVKNILLNYNLNEPFVACFSLSMWNYNLSMSVAKELKKCQPGCQIVLGGASVPKKNNYDFIIFGEGEHKFAEFLAKEKLPQPKNLDDYPSPYTQGLFDYLINDKTKYQVIVETSRGCPFSCAYCYWGNGVSKRMRFFSKDYITNVAEWIGKNKIEYIFCADSNFGMFNNDVDVAHIFSSTKKKYGYPKKFRVCYGKGTRKSIIETAKILYKSDLAKSVTLSKQTSNESALKNINRSNIKEKDFVFLQNTYKKLGIPTYSEFILGLPGETKDSFIKGINEAVKYKENNLFIYHCSILPNTEMDHKEYRKKFNIITSYVPISEVHCEARKDNIIEEFEEIIIGTSTMTTEEWIHCAVYSWEIQLKHSLGYKKPISKNEKNWLFYIAKRITQGNRRVIILPEFGNIYWEPEEALYLTLTAKNEKYKKEFAREHILYARKGKKKKNASTVQID